MEEAQNFGYITTPEMAKNLQAALEKPTLPFLVLFYADWCGHCQTYKPQWENFIKNRNIHVAAVQDEQMENVPSLKDAVMQGFPTVILIDKEGKKTTISSEDMRNEEAMMKYLSAKENPVRSILKGGARLIGYIRSMTRSMSSRRQMKRQMKRQSQRQSRRNPNTRKMKRKGRHL